MINTPKVSAGYFYLVFPNPVLFEMGTETVVHCEDAVIHSLLSFITLLR